MELTLKVGQTHVLKRSFLGRNLSLTYAGMPNGGTWSLAVTWGHNYQAAGYNLFLPLEQRELTLLKARLLVHGVTPQELHLQIQT